MASQSVTRERKKSAERNRKGEKNKRFTSLVTEELLLLARRRLRKVRGVVTEELLLLARRRLRKVRGCPLLKGFMAFKPSESELKLFPLHPENLVNHLSREPEDKDIVGNMAWFLDSEGDATINGLLGSSSASDDDPSPTAFPSFGRGPDDNSDGSGGLALTALRHRGRVVDEPERWVFFHRVVVEEEACSSNSSGSGSGSGGFWCTLVEDHHQYYHQQQQQQQGLSLKLDYEEVLNAWSDKGSLYIEGECPQTVPRRDDDYQMPNLMNVGSMDMVCGRNNAAPASTWMMVPDGSSSGGGSTAEDGGEGKQDSREARVLRYKEKRQSRLFSKRIRYEVRKLNAEKRPRMKGRFVKRMGEFST